MYDTLSKFKLQNAAINFRGIFLPAIYNHGFHPYDKTANNLRPSRIFTRQLSEKAKENRIYARHQRRRCIDAEEVREVEVIVCFSAGPALSLQRFLSLKPFARTRETPLWALPCVSNEFTWRPTVYLRHFLPSCVCVRVRAGRPACGQRFPAAGRCCGPSSRGPLEIRNSVWLYPICPPRQGRTVLSDSSLVPIQSSFNDTAFF